MGETEQKPCTDGSPELKEELDRVEVSLRTAQLGDAVIAGRTAGTIWIMAALDRDQPPRCWEGTEDLALALLSRLPDRAGPEEFWKMFMPRMTPQPEGFPALDGEP